MRFRLGRFPTGKHDLRATCGISTHAANTSVELIVLTRRALLVTGALPIFATSIDVVVAAEQAIIVFAAASLKNALDAVNAAFTSETGTRVSASYAASSALMKQIENGAPAQVFVSADEDWMNYGTQRNLIKKDSRIDLLGNELVLIAAAQWPIGPVLIAPGFDVAALAGDGRIVTADVRSVPAGKYTKAALEKLGAWEKAAPKLAMTENVRAALTLVARGEAVLGIVYATDAKVEPRVKVIGTFPADSHPPIVYPASLTANGGAQAERYLAFLRSPPAKGIFESFGFVFLPTDLVIPARRGAASPESMTTGLGLWIPALGLRPRPE
jgi:molybdate transport system substrate-binding protein